MKFLRREFMLLAGSAAALPAASRLAWALDYPSRQVHLIVGFPAGNASDILARLVGQSVSERLGQQFIIENRPGAGSNVGTETVVKAPPDGYTLLLVTPSNAINTSLYEKLNFNFIRDIAPVASVVSSPYVVAVNPSLSAHTVPGFIAYAKANPGKINMASTGIGTSTHIFGELFQMMTGINMVHVPYRGNFVPDLIGGQVTRPRSHHRDALASAAGRTGRGRIRPRLRGERLVWRRCTQANIRRDHRKAQP